jgi:hypothetical protein
MCVILSIVHINLIILIHGRGTAIAADHLINTIRMSIGMIIITENAHNQSIKSNQIESLNE